MCENDGYRILDCSDCGTTVAREGADNFDELWNVAPWWYDVDVDDSTSLMSDEKFHAMMNEALTLPLIQIKRGGVRFQ
jgi:hypothetical protein